MLNYDEIVTQANEYRSLRLTAAEQQRLEQSLAPTQPHPILLWVGQQLIALGQQLQGERQMAALSVSPVAFAR
jgi:hypothetical protein